VKGKPSAWQMILREKRQLPTKSKTTAQGVLIFTIQLLVSPANFSSAIWIKRNILYPALSLLMRLMPALIRYTSPAAGLIYSTGRIDAKNGVSRCLMTIQKISVIPKIILKSVIKQEAPANRGFNPHTLNQTKTNY
jgi:hypothetical protein